MFKHGVLLALVAAMKRGGAPLRVLETHAGAGLYDLRGDEARKSKEAQAGVMRLMADPKAPAPFDALKAAILFENTDQQIAFYPGSPLLVSATISLDDLYIGCELRSDDQAALARLFSNRRHVGAPRKAELADGYVFALNPPPWRGNTLILIDPPFERGDEYDQIVNAAAGAIGRRDALAIWTPIKDLETLDALVSRLEGLSPASLLVAEVRLRRLADPTKMNGCAMILIDTPDIEHDVAAMAQWVVAHCGEVGGTARVTTA